MELIHELAEFEKAPNEVTVDFNHFVNSGFGERPVWWAYVAEMETGNVQKKIVGFALYYIRYSTWKGQRMYLEDIIVTKELRGNGIGKLLLEKLIEVAKAEKFNGITWQVLDWNKSAIRFYQKFENVKFDHGWVNVIFE